MKTTCCVQVNLCQKLLFLHQLTHNLTTCSVLVIFMVHNFMNNLLSYCGLVDATISAFEKDLPVSNKVFFLKVQRIKSLQIDPKVL